MFWRCIIGFSLLTYSTQASEIRIKDITRVHGQRINQLMGIGFVYGLNGTGGSSPQTRQIASNIAHRFGLRSDPAVRAALDLDTTRPTDNLSVVLVTVNLPSFAREGSQLDVTLGVFDDATSLQGGILTRTLLYGIDEEVYAIASGQISTGGFSFSGQAGSVQQNHPTSGRIVNGATVEKETCTPIGQDGKVKLILNNPDYETARRIAAAINVLAPQSAYVIDPATVQTRIPPQYHGQPVEWISKIEQLTVAPDVVAKVVINERTGTVIIGEHVKLSRVLITHSNLTVITNESPQVSQPAPFSEGETVVVPRTELTVEEDGVPVTEVTPNVTVGDLAFALNSLGVAPRDLSSIFQQLKESGALHAELEFK